MGMNEMSPPQPPVLVAAGFEDDDIWQLGDQIAELDDNDRQFLLNYLYHYNFIREK